MTAEFISHMSTISCLVKIFGLLIFLDFYEILDMQDIGPSTNTVRRANRSITTISDLLATIVLSVMIYWSQNKVARFSKTGSTHTCNNNIINRYESVKAWCKAKASILCFHVSQSDAIWRQYFINFPDL